ncbi:MAG TPA: CotH kinase family protein, partial [Kofleriaceae bacterium]|nr:CotH kinase family protein [Kofleriaceae bacterium]
RMVARWFDDAAGPLYEATDVDFAPAYVDAFEHESGPDDRSLIRQAAEALAGGDPAAALSAVAAYIDMVHFRRFWAMTAVLGQFDAFPYSNPGDDYFVYADPESARLHFIPWGMDETFYSGSHDVKLVTSVLATTCMEVPSCWDPFVDEVWQVMDEVDRMDLLGRLDVIAAQIAPHIARDTRKPYTNTRVRTYQENIRWFLNDRRSSLEEMLGPPDQDLAP